MIFSLENKNTFYQTSIFTSNKWKIQEIPNLDSKYDKKNGEKKERKGIVRKERIREQRKIRNWESGGNEKEKRKMSYDFRNDFPSFTKRKKGMQQKWVKLLSRIKNKTKIKGIFKKIHKNLI